MKKAMANTRVSVKLRKTEYRDEWYLYIEAYPVFQKGSSTPQRVREYLNRTISTPIWDKSRKSRTNADGKTTYKPKRDTNGVILCKSQLDQENCIYADKVRSIRQKEYDNAALYSDTDAQQAEMLERSRCNFIEYFNHVQQTRHVRGSESIIVNWRRVHELLKIFADGDTITFAQILTTNFDMNLNEGLTLCRLESENLKFTDYYPWNVYFAKIELNSSTEGFGVWYINGMLKYKRSIRLGLSEYMSLSSRVRTFLHKGDGLDDFDLKNQNRWKGYSTWLHIIFNKSLCIFGLALDENETFLRWLLIERAKYFKRFPERKKKAWFVCKAGECSEGKRLYLDYLGFELVQLNSYEDIYKGMFLG